MANIRFSRKEIEKEIKLNEDTVEKISMLGVPAVLSPEYLEIEIFPNRPDIIPIKGFLRAAKAFLGKNIGLKKYRINAPEKDFRVKIDSSVKQIRPYTACAIVKNLVLDDEKIKGIIDMQEKLHNTTGRNRKKAAIGIYPLDKINLPIKYEARKAEDIKFIHLGSEEEMSGRQILERHPTGKEYAHLLEGFDKLPVFIDSAGKILSMPPIINSNETGKVTQETKDVFVECTGSDFDVLKTILNIIITSLADMGGKIFAMELDYGKKTITPDLNSRKMKISLDNINKILGLNLKEKDLEKLLPRMEYEYKSGSVKIPPWRLDILHEVDVIEDIAIAFGYENLTPEIPKVSTIAQESKEGKIKAKTAEILSGLGMVEISSYHLIKQIEAENLSSEHKIELENSKTEYKFLRPNLLIPALRILAENKDNEYPQKIFELGVVFEKKNEIKESEHLLIAFTPGNFTEMKQSLDYLFAMLGLKYEIKESEKHWLIDGRTCSILLNNKEIGQLGEVHPETLRSWNIKMPVGIIEISLEGIFSSILS